MRTLAIFRHFTEISNFMPKNNQIYAIYACFDFFTFIHFLFSSMKPDMWWAFLSIILETFHTIYSSHVIDAHDEIDNDKHSSFNNNLVFLHECIYTMQHICRCKGCSF